MTIQAYLQNIIAEIRQFTIDSNVATSAVNVTLQLNGAGEVCEPGDAPAATIGLTLPAPPLPGCTSQS